MSEIPPELAKPAPPDKPPENVGYSKGRTDQQTLDLEIVEEARKVLAGELRPSQKQVMTTAEFPSPGQYTASDAGWNNACDTIAERIADSYKPAPK